MTDGKQNPDIAVSFTAIRCNPNNQVPGRAGTRGTTVDFAGNFVSLPKLTRCHGPVVHSAEGSSGISGDRAGKT